MEMNWTKVTPDTMPPVGQRCFLTSVNPDGSKTIDIATWSGEDMGWNILLLGYHYCTLEDDEYSFTFTHWMLYPEPAKDDE